MRSTIINLFLVVIIIIMIIYFSRQVESLRLNFSNQYSALRYTANNSRAPIVIADVIDMPIPIAFIEDVESWDKNYARWTADIEVRTEQSFRFKTSYQPPSGVTYLGALYSNDTPIAQMMSANDTFICCFRGTASIEELKRDADYPQTSTNFLPPELMVHSGFNYTYQQFRDQLILNFNTYGSSKALIIGHSLGGALALMASIDISTNTKAEYIGVHTYASPRMGNIEFGIYYNSRPNMKCHTMINTQDIVPSLPPTISPNAKDPPYPYYYYESVGNVIQFTIQNYSWYMNHIMTCYVEYIDSLP